jgi:uncharacterized protein
MKFKVQLKAAITALCFLQAGTVFAQTPPPARTAPVVQRTANPALWVVKDEDTTIYLFGTIHLLPEGLNWNLGAVKTAFESADTLKLEIANLESETPVIQALMAEKGILPAGQSLNDGLNDAQKAQLARIVSEAGMPPQALDTLRPWMASVVLGVTMVQKMGFDPTKGVDKTLDTLARARGIPVEGFETGTEQIGFIAGMTPTQQHEMLLSTLEEWDTSKALIDDMLKAWSRGNANRVGSLISGSLRSQPELGRVLLTDRNRRWADWIGVRMATPGTVFMAVGAGHLAGPDSVQTFLAAKGLRAKRLPNRPSR